MTADDGSVKTVSFEQAIIAAGSEPMTLPFIPNDDPRVIDSTGALELDGVPRAAAGARRRDHRPRDGDRLLRARRPDHRRRADGPAHSRRVDKDIVTPLTKRITKRYENIYLKTKVTAVEAS